MEDHQAQECPAAFIKIKRTVLQNHEQSKDDTRYKRNGHNLEDGPHIIEAVSTLTIVFQSGRQSPKASLILLQYTGKSRHQA